MTQNSSENRVRVRFKEALKLHGEYTESLKNWRTYREKNSQKIALWSTIFWIFQNANQGKKEGEVNVDIQDMREAVDVPGSEDIDEWVASVGGFDEESSMSDLIENKDVLSHARFESASEGGWGEFISFGREIERKKSECGVESRAKELHNYIFYGGRYKGPSDLGKEDRCGFQQKFALAPYKQQVVLTNLLTRKLGRSQFGREILSKLANPQVPRSQQKLQHFRALYLFNPRPIWTGYTKGYDPLVNVPVKQGVKNGQSSLIGIDGDGLPYAKDRKLANRLTVLASRLMPGVAYYQKKICASQLLSAVEGVGKSEAKSLRNAGYEDLDDVESVGKSKLKTVNGINSNLASRIKKYEKNNNYDTVSLANHQIWSLMLMIDGGIKDRDWKKFKLNVSNESPSRVFQYLLDAISVSGTILDEYTNVAKSRYKKLSNLGSNFLSLFSLLGATAEAVAKANRDKLDFTPGGAYNAISGFHSAAGLTQTARNKAGLSYDTIEFRNGKMVKRTIEGPATATKVLDGVGKLFDAIDAILNGMRSWYAAQRGEYDVSVWAGIGAALAIGGLFLSSWWAIAIHAVLCLVVGYITDWVSDGPVTTWLENTIFGDGVSAQQNTNPSSDWFGYDGYKRVLPPKGWNGKGGALSRQIAGFYNLIQPFSVGGMTDPDLVKIKKDTDSNTYESTISITNITNGGVGSGFLIQPIYKQNGEYKVGNVAKDVHPIWGPSGTWQGVDNESVKNNVKLTAVPTFNEGTETVRDPATPLKSIGLNFSDAGSVSDLFGFDPRNKSGSSYLEILHVPANFRAKLGKTLNEVKSNPSRKFIDAIADQQPFPRQRIPVRVV